MIPIGSTHTKTARKCSLLRGAFHCAKHHWTRRNKKHRCANFVVRFVVVSVALTLNKWKKNKKNIMALMTKVKKDCSCGEEEHLDDDCWH
jgi:hypothetical protein